ncbi:MAG: hypothetical protein H0U60_20090 [Blastocatellia bacterium]|nr:hypothetical protein [Blastocatellia bacterium]
MAATFAWDEDTGTATGSPTKGTTRTAGVTDVNWKNSGTQGTAYSAAPITAGNNSFEKWQFGHFSGTYNEISAGLFAHTATSFGTGLTLKGPTAMTADGDNETYTTPAATTNANLSVNMTTAIAIASGSAVWFGATGPEATGKTATATANPGYTNWLVTQLQTTVSAVAGDTATVTLTLQYNEN